MEITFDMLNLSKTTMDAITKKGFSVASEIQGKAIPVIFEQEKDIVGIAQTGTGKTGAFGLPLVDLVESGNKTPQAIILAPTRELALQVTKELTMFCGNKKLNIETIYGGASIQGQIKSLRRGVDIVVGTPGRVVDLLNKGELKLEKSKYFILDEADEMLNMGFIEDIEFILSSSAENRRVYLFSATMPQRIKNLSKKYMNNQIIIEVKKKNTNNELIEQVFYKSKQSEKFDALIKLIDVEDFFYGIIFCRTKADVDNVTQSLKKSGHEVDCIHGDVPQNRRERILMKFREQKLSILVATDVAARGIDVDSLSHVVNYNLPDDVETYTHRIGRTGRAGKSGKAISLVTQGELRRITQIERELKIKIEGKKLPTDKEISLKTKSKFLDEINENVSKVNLDKHMPIIDELLSKHDHIRLIGALLEKLNSKTQQKKSDKKDDFEHPRSKNRGGSGEEKRVFIAKGRFDNMDKKGLIHFIEKETRVKLGKVKDVKVCDKFSFLTLDSYEAEAVVEKFEQNSRGRKPLAEFAQR